MFTDNNLLGFLPQFAQIFAKNPQLSDIKPSEWAEKNIIIPGGKGRLSYDFNPYCREIIDTLSPNHPARKIAVMKGSQITFSSGVIMPALGYIMAENPGNTYLSVGKPGLIKPAGEKLDLMIQGAKLQDLVAKYTVNRAKNNKSGDTDEMKYFPGGYARLTCITDSKDVAQVDLDNIFLDDFDSMKGVSKDGGNLLDLMQMRAASNANTYKLMMISTPLLKGTSNIEPAFLNGDRRYYFVNCPCCHQPIIFKKSVAEGEIINPLIETEIAAGQGGMHFEVNNHGQLIEKSVGYICYKCAGFFTDKNKQKLIREAQWIPTGIPISKDYYSYRISSLYAPVSMFNWAYYMGKEIEANPKGQPRNEYKAQVLQNTCYGETYEAPAESPKATEIMKNKRSYKIGTIPDKMSIADGNGKIVLVTFACDGNGVVDDARIDWEVVAWAENGASYSVQHGSVGTFISREGNNKRDRVHMTYEHGKENSVWAELDRIMRTWWVGQSGLVYQANKPCVDVGHMSEYILPFIDWTIGRYPGNPCVGVRGNKEDKYLAYGTNLSLFEQGKARNDVYWLQVGLFKDKAAHNMLLKWKDGETTQPPYYMNFPLSENGLYEYENYFEHYESEHRTLVEDSKGGKLFRWVKKTTTVQNHMWDVRIYHMAMLEVIIKTTGKELGEKEFTLVDYVNYVTT
jgi:phage terminase large subunit GpA-like protein